MAKARLAHRVLFPATLLAASACGPATPPDRPPPSRREAQVPAAAPEPIASDAGTVPLIPPRAQRFVEAGTASPWSFPDATRRKDRAQRLANKLSAQLDAEHDRTATGASFSFALVIDGAVVLLKAKGVADLENKRVATPDTIYRIASITKTFTASAVMLLRDEGKLAIGDPLAGHLPDLDVLYPHHDAAPIRIEQVLTHSAGFARSGPYAELARPSTEEDLTLAMKLPLAGDPGLGHRYSNFGFGLLGLMVGRKSGMPYRDFVRTRLLEPLRMTSSGFDVAQLPPDRLAVAYQRSGAAQKPTMNGAGEGAGGLYATARDLAEWIRFQLAAWPPRDDADEGPLRRSTIREMHQPRLPFDVGSRSLHGGGGTRAFARSVGLTWEVLKGCYFDRLVGHDGDLDGFHARLRFDVDRNLGFVLLGNSDTADMSGVAERILDTIAGEDLLAPRRREPAPALVARVEAAVKRLGTSWTEADHAETFSEAARARLPLPEAVAIGTRIAKDVGTCTFARADVVTDALDAELVFQCTRGTLRAAARGTGSPVRLVGFKVDVMTPANDDELAVGRELVARMSAKDDAALAKALGTKAGVAVASRTLLAAGNEAGACKLEGGEISPWSHAGSFRLACRRTRATLRVQRRDSGVLELVGVDAPVHCLR